jgi:DNA polymerase III delta subunit
MNGNLYLLAGNDSYLMKKRSESIMADHGVDSVDVEFFDMDETGGRRCR